MTPAPARLILNVVCHEWSITPTKLRARDRHAELVEARRYAAYLLTVDGGLTNNRAGYYLDRHHATVMHHRRALARHREDRDVQVTLAALRRLIRDAQQQRQASADLRKDHHRHATPQRPKV